MAAVTVVKLWLAVHFHGFLSGDDLEVVEAAAKYALGLDYAPWSLRCLFHPVVLVAPILGAGAMLGVRGAIDVAWLAALPTLAASTITVWLVFRFALLSGWPRRVGSLAAFFYASHWLPLGYGAAPYPRPISTMLFMLALVLVPERPAAWTAAGGFLVGAAFAVRFSEGVLLVPFLWVVWVLLSDGTRMHAVEVIPTHLPYHPSELDERILGTVIAMTKADCFRGNYATIFRSVIGIRSRIGGCLTTAAYPNPSAPTQGDTRLYRG